MKANLTIMDIMDGNGNAFAVMARVSQALKTIGRTQEEIKQYRNRATEADYDHLLAVSMEELEKAGYPY